MEYGIFSWNAETSLNTFWIVIPVDCYKRLFASVAGKIDPF